MNLLFDTSVWVAHVRGGALDTVLPRIRRGFFLGMDAVTASELRAGCRSKRERRSIERIIHPFERAGRLSTPNGSEWERAALALSRLREAGHTLRNPGGALLDAVIAAVASARGALLVSENLADFSRLATYMPLTVRSLASFESQLS